MLIEIKNNRSCYYIDDYGRKQGEYKSQWSNGMMCEHSAYVNDRKHGECKQKWMDGELVRHCFYIDGREVSFNEIPYPSTPEDRMYFILKHDIPLIPVETTC